MTGSIAPFGPSMHAQMSIEHGHSLPSRLLVSGASTHHRAVSQDLYFVFFDELLTWFDYYYLWPCKYI